MNGTSFFKKKLLSPRAPRTYSQNGMISGSFRGEEGMIRGFFLVKWTNECSVCVDNSCARQFHSFIFISKISNRQFSIILLTFISIIIFKRQHIVQNMFRYFCHFCWACHKIRVYFRLKNHHRLNNLILIFNII